MSFNLEKDGAPTFQAVTLDEMKAHARIYTTADDAYIGTLIDAATDQLEHDTDTVIRSQGFVLHLNHWLDRSYYERLFGFYGFAPGHFQAFYQDNATPKIHLPVQPILSVDSIAYTDTDGGSQTLDPSLYQLRKYTDPAEILWVDSASLPPIQTNSTIDISFTGGFDTADDVPALMKHGVKFLASHWYEHRESASEQTVKSVPDAYDRIVTRLRVKRYR